MTFLILLVSALIVVLDQLFKYIVVNNLKPDGTINVIDGLLSFTYLENRGAAFGILSNQRWFFILSTILIICVLIYLIFSKKFDSKLFGISSAFIIGGGVGNLIDRIYMGYVVDYIQVSFFPPVCNFADYCVCIGTIMLSIWIIWGYGKEKTTVKK